MEWILARWPHIFACGIPLLPLLSFPFIERFPRLCDILHVRECMWILFPTNAVENGADRVRIFLNITSIVDVSYLDCTMYLQFILYTEQGGKKDLQVNKFSFIGPRIPVFAWKSSTIPHPPREHHAPRGCMHAIVRAYATFFWSVMPLPMEQYLRAK